LTFKKSDIKVRGCFPNPDLEIAMKSITGIFFGGILLLSSIGLNLVQYNAQNKSNFLTEIEGKRSRILQDQVTELMYNLQEKTMQAELAKNEGFNEGVNNVIKNADPNANQWSQTWHNGYYRGLEQTAVTKDLEYEKGYDLGFNQGQRENMKAITTILKSGNDIQTAMQKFADDLISKDAGKTAETEKAILKKNK
jgi:hypothetical protein